MKLVSVIVPAYNCIATIERCIVSLINQTYKNIEIIIIDDESTDGTREKCSKLAKENSLVKFFSISHCGVSDVRNEALLHASGYYIMFVDADDYVKDRFVMQMVLAIEESSDCDMAICSYKRVVYGDSYPIRTFSAEGMISKEEYLLKTLKDPGHHYFGVLWNKIFKREIIAALNLRFKKDITLGEDFVFSLNYLQNASKVNVINDRLYYYCYQQNDTLSRIIEKSLKNCVSEMQNRDKIFSNYVETMQLAGLYNKKIKGIYHYWIVFLVRQRYSLKTEYKWSKEDKRILIEKMHKNANIKRALQIYSRSEVQLEYILFAGAQTIKNILKKMVKLVKT